jgi:regulation of enolase protein 1 (concanavalin A-like superfamily)
MKKVTFLIVVCFLLAACAPAATPIPAATEPPAPTDIDVHPTEVVEVPSLTPTETNVPPPEPTVTQTEIPPTALPEGVLFRDDFEGELQPGWAWINEDPERWSFENGWLKIVANDFAFYMDDNYGMVNFLTREAPEGEFMITAHIRADPTENFQQAAIYIFEDKDNYIALNIGYCGVCTTNGPGFYMETFIDNNPFQDAYALKRDANETNVYLRLVNQSGSVTGYYATTPGEWQRAGAFGNYFDFKYVGLGTTNSTNADIPNLVSTFDFFEIANPQQ